MDTKSEEKLSIIELLKRVGKLLFGNINLALFLFLFSLPLFYFLIFFEFSLQTTVSLTFQFLSQQFNSKENLSENDLIPWLIQTCLLCFFPYTFLDLFTTTMIVVASSIVYTSKEEPLGLLCLVWRSFKICHNRIGGCLLTSLYVLLFSTSVFFGFFSDSINNLFIASLSREYKSFHNQAPMLFHAVLVIHGTVLIVLTAKFSKWSTGWNMVLVVSVLKEEEDGRGLNGTDALSLSALYGRGHENRDRWMMLMFLVFALAMRMPCLYFKCNESLSGNGVMYTGLYVSLICVGNMLKWVSFVVCYHDCKTRGLEKKCDVEIGSKS